MSSAPAILFDVDGTLAETERDGHRVAFNRAFAEAAVVHDGYAPDTPGGLGFDELARVLHA